VNKVERQDSWTNLAKLENDRFLTLHPLYNQLIDRHGSYKEEQIFGLIFVEDTKVHELRRQVVTIWKILSSLGGIINAIFLFLTCLLWKY